MDDARLRFTVVGAGVLREGGAGMPEPVLRTASRPRGLGGGRLVMSASGDMTERVKDGGRRTMGKGTPKGSGGSFLFSGCRPAKSAQTTTPCESAASEPSTEH
jgi:hypothetical protein